MKNKHSFIFLLGLLSAIGPFSIDMYLPGFPSIARDLQTTVHMVAYSLSSFFIGISTGQLFFGPLLDRFGRKKPLITGLIIYTLASLGCTIAGSVEILIICRFFQALGACAGLVAPRAIVRDTFPINDNPRIFSQLVLVLGISPVIAPSIGSYVVSAYGWPPIFLLLTFLGFILLIGTYYIIENGSPEDISVSLKPRAILKSYMLIGKDPRFLTYSLINGLSASGFYCYLAGSPGVFMNYYKLDTHHYAYLFTLIAIGLIGSSQLNTHLLKKNSPKIIIRSALIVQSTLGLLLVILSISGSANIYMVIILIFLFICCQGLTTPNATALAMAPFTKGGGTAAALLGAMQMALGAIASAAVSYLSGNSPFIMTTGMFICAFGGIFIVFSQSRNADSPPKSSPETIAF
jgi:DHA1 family bicyclomycin/chloramphenicol resistance-like MFS transporter